MAQTQLFLSDRLNIRNEQRQNKTKQKHYEKFSNRIHRFLASK